MCEYKIYKQGDENIDLLHGGVILQGSLSLMSLADKEENEKENDGIRKATNDVIKAGVEVDECGPGYKHAHTMPAKAEPGTAKYAA